MPFDHQTLSVRLGGFASANRLTNEADLRWAVTGGDLQAGDGGSPQLPTGWGVYECAPGGVTECLHLPSEECTDGTCDLAAHLLISRKFNSYFYDYIYPAVMLLGLSYLALFVDKQNPGRPGIHSVTGAFMQSAHNVIPGMLLRDCCR